jgi:tRNA(fMet)-specific endonuclease VapC
VTVSYLVDTNIVSEIMRPQPDIKVQSQWRVNAENIAISAITWHELLAGTFRLPASKRRTAYEHFLVGVLSVVIPILPYDERAATWHAAERVRLAEIGRTPSFADGQIAGIAATQNLILVTRNSADFADFVDLRLENWFSAN